MGGCFKVLSGQIKAHVQPDLCCCPPAYYDVDAMSCVKNQLQFYTFGPNLSCLATLWSRDPDPSLHLRASGEHTHFFSLDGGCEAGHYHGDTTPQEVSYEGYFVVAENITKVRDAVAEARRYHAARGGAA